MLGYELKIYNLLETLYVQYWTQMVNGEDSTTLEFQDLTTDLIAKPGEQIGFTIAANNLAGVGVRSPMLEMRRNT